MSRFNLRALLCVAVLALLCVSCVSAFNPYETEDDTGSGVAPSTSTLSCTVDPKTGEEHCESIAKEVLSEEELEAKIAAAEAEREAIAQKKAAAKAERDAKYQAEREAKREAKRLKDLAHQEEQQKKKQGPNQDDYKGIKAPLKKLKVDYYRYFGVERDAGKLQIRKAANNMALVNHPDKCPTTACKEAMIVINQARDVLLDDETRAQYDFLLSYGFKIYDRDLYTDMWKQFKEDPTNMPTGFAGVSHPDSDFSSMQVSEEGAGWLLLLTGSITLAMVGLPVYKVYEKAQKSTSAEAKKAALKKEMLAQQARAKEELANSLKKKQDKFTGDRTVKRAEIAQNATKTR